MVRVSHVLLAAALIGAPAYAQSLTTTFNLNGSADGMMFDLTARKTIQLTGFDYHPRGGGPGIFNTIEVYYVSDRSTYEGKESDPELWTLLGRETVETVAYPPATHVDIGGLILYPGETIGIYFTEINVAPTSIARTAGPLGVFENDDLIFEDRGAAIFYPFASVFTPRVWNGTIHYEDLSYFGAGDMNCDGAFNGADIDPFFMALADPAKYVARYSYCYLFLADMNRDGRVDGADIDPFFACLAGNCP